MTAATRQSAVSYDPPGFEAALAAAREVLPRPEGSSRKPRILLISKYFKLAYRVLRCAKAAGCDVFVLSTLQGASLRMSRLCDGFDESNRDILGQFDPALALEINDRVKRLEIDMVLPGDAPSTRSLIAIRHLISAPCFPMPGLVEFDLLNDKWRFAGLCDKLDIKSPNSRLFESVERLLCKVESEQLELPKIAKPLSLDSGNGCVVLKDRQALAKLDAVTYRPIIVQDYIEGQDIGASVFCSGGRIKAFVAHLYRRDSYETFFTQSIYDDIAKICAYASLSGVYNFDMRLDEEGNIYFLECNPRFFFKIAMSMLAGINFVALGLPGRELTEGQQVCASTVVQFPKAMLAALPTPWRLGAKSWDALKYVASDPVPYLREQLGLEPGAGMHS